jgi:hypothetical protein
MSRLRSHFARIVVGLAVALGALVGVTALTSEDRADAAAPACVSPAEFRQIRRGMTPAQVTNLTGVRGVVTSSFNSGGYRSVSKEYRPCVGRPYSFVDVSYWANPGQALKVDGKFAYWG